VTLFLFFFFFFLERKKEPERGGERDTVQFGGEDGRRERVRVFGEDQNTHVVADVPLALQLQRVLDSSASCSR
jgi:hypothetical protein